MADLDPRKPRYVSLPADEPANERRVGGKVFWMFVGSFLVAAGFAVGTFFFMWLGVAMIAFGAITFTVALLAARATR